MTFQANFTALAGFPPMSWQVRLFHDWLARGALPSGVDIPTGLGKTTIMALWLIARAQGARLPRRLVYVVDRRAVVDQATSFAETLRASLDAEAKGLKGSLGLAGRSLPISTLRGAHIDNREWLDDPSATAIIVGTVDMIGSRLMFEGFGVSRKMRPYHAGLLGADALVILDEAHLVPPFEKLLESIETNPSQYAPIEEAHRALIPRFKLVSLSATGRERLGDVFSLQESDLEEPHLATPITLTRLNATKRVTLRPAGEKDLPERLAAEAWQISRSAQEHIRCIIYCNKRETAKATKAALDRLVSDLRKKDPGHSRIDTELFVGARRNCEREKAAKRLADLGFIAAPSGNRNGTAFLVATSAGEVGVDLDADHMVCDLVAWERMVQRLGRVNRRGLGDATVIVLDPIPAKEKKADTPAPADLRAIKQHEALLALLHSLPKYEDGSADGSPNALRALKRCENLRLLISEATSAAPLRPALTRALVDAWSMTSLKEHTGRPDIDPWLRGWVEDRPSTAIIWRRYLPIRASEHPVEPSEIEDFFEAAPPHASEILETETWQVVDWLMSVAAKRSGKAKNLADNNGSLDGELDTVHEGDERASLPAAALRSDEVIAIALSPAGDLRQRYGLKDLISADKKIETSIRDRLNRSLAGATLVVDARLGGLTSDGLLSEHDTTDSPNTADGADNWMALLENTPTAKRAESVEPPLIRFRLRSVAATNPVVSEDNRHWRERLRFSAERSDEGETLRWLVVDKWRYDAANEHDRSVGPSQSLDAHRSAAAAKAREIASRIGLPRLEAQALEIATRLHDEGKRAEHWQRAFNAPRQGGPYAKTEGPCNIRLLNGYRHEFGSLRYAEADPEVQTLPADLQELVLHLIAAHHGQARPLIRTSGCDDGPPSTLEAHACKVALRFARLQKRWGPWGLAWWESLLRAADQQASRENDCQMKDKKRESP
ncbi:type I-U CRISPR-associated helicase/endonuclease Cas3 [uncultured Thiodictyon sp.]|jgi:CRISPR-associated endonuclease/helicase Cas3|uniref:type I-G CRISPR-associated helicase/endonuclease Cas3g n=1 Tax=uncultured Thiodictyon sp. TaxID=1846217 RepID=UPI0025E75165|nr:type I-U CRISPR-associated helicase/endonuclease Cas3 [uncultured Thiodictyon sp.]